MPYTTAELIDILDRELRANWRGERVLISANERIQSPAIAMALDPDKLSKVFAYREFRNQIHEYQREYGVSGIVWRTCKFRDRKLPVPEVHDHLVAIGGDKQILIDAKAETIQFWWDSTMRMKYWLSDRTYRHLSRHELEVLVNRSEWATLDAAREELFLGLCWGTPEDCQYDWAKPKSGCNRVVAAVEQPSSVKF